MAIYTGDGQLKWREVEGGQLPSPRRGVRGVVVDNIVVITGGRDSSHNILLSNILSWDPVAESWQPAGGKLAVPRSYHAAVAIPSSLIESECSAIFQYDFERIH